MERHELMKKLDEQMKLLEFHLSHVESFELSAYDISIRIRTLVHDTKNSKSLLQMLNMKNIEFYDTSSPIGSISHWSGNINIAGWNMNVLPHIGIVHKHVEITNNNELSIEYYPIFTKSLRKDRKTDFISWWTMIIFDNKLGQTLTREQLVRNAANKDGGAHIDEPSSSYKLFSKNDVMKFKLNDLIKGASNIPLYSCIAQVGWEIFHSIKDELRIK
jgi:hypothetical protein